MKFSISMKSASSFPSLFAMGEEGDVRNSVSRVSMARSSSARYNNATSETPIELSLLNKTNRYSHSHWLFSSLLMSPLLSSYTHTTPTGELPSLLTRCR